MTTRRPEPPDVTELEASASWSVEPADTRVGRLCAYALAGCLGAPVVGVLALIAIGLAETAASGDYETLVMFFVLFVIGGPISLVGLLAALAADEIALPDWLAPADPDVPEPATASDRVVLGLGGVFSLALAAGLALVAATSARDGVAMVYWGASIPGVVGVLLLVLAGRRA